MPRAASARSQRLTGPTDPAWLYEYMSPLFRAPRAGQVGARRANGSGRLTFEVSTQPSARREIEARMSATFPARLHVLLASEAPVGAVFRRGAANAVCSVLWDRRKETFE